MCFGSKVEEQVNEVETPEVEVSNTVEDTLEKGEPVFGSTEIEKNAAEFLILFTTLEIIAKYREKAGKAGLHAIARTILSLSLGNPTSESEAAFQRAIPQTVEQYFKDHQIEEAAKAEKAMGQSAVAGR